MSIIVSEGMRQMNAQQRFIEHQKALAEMSALGQGSAQSGLRDQGSGGGKRELDISVKDQMQKDVNELLKGWDK